MIDYIPLAEIEQISFEVTQTGKNTKAQEAQQQEDEQEDRRKGGFFQGAFTRTAVRRVIAMIENYTGLYVNDDGLKGKIPDIDETCEEVHLIISTIEGGHNAGRSSVT
jgi:hypothetical protein